MIPSTTETVIPVTNPQPKKIKLVTLLTSTTYLMLFRFVGRIFTSIRGGGPAPLRHLWTHYYRRVAIGEEGVFMPHSALSFIINVLLALAEIKSQGQPEFPFQTHPQIVMFSVTILLIYGLASAAEIIIFAAAGVDPTSVYAVIAHLGKIGSLCILVVSLASLFYI